MIIERVETVSDFESLGTAWDAVYDHDPEAQFFLSRKWLAGVLNTYPGQWMVLVARGADGRCLGFLPLQLKTVWSERRQRLRNELHFAGRLFWADYGGILCLPDHEEAVLGAFASYLKQMNWSHIYLKNFRISDRRFGLFMEPFADERLIVESLTRIINDGQTDNLLCPYIDLPDTFDAYLDQRLGSNTRQTIRGFVRKIESSSEYTITTTTAATQSRDVLILEQLWGNMWRSLKGSDTQRLATKYGMIVARGLSDGLVHMPILWHREVPIFVLASFVDWRKSRLLPFMTARNEDFRDHSAGFRNLSVGLVIHAHSIRWAIEHGIKTYDLLRGNEPYKYSLGAVDVRLKYPLIRARSGTNLNGSLDPGCIGEALRIADDLARRKLTREAATACRQILATLPEQETAKRLLNALADDSSNPAHKAGT